MRRHPLLTAAALVLVIAIVSGPPLVRSATSTTGSPGVLPSVADAPVWPEPKIWTAGATAVGVNARMHVGWGLPGGAPATAPLQRAFARFLTAAFPHPTAPAAAGGAGLLGRLSVSVADASAELQLGASEAYVLVVPAATGANISLSADTQFGVYRGLETLAQLVSFDFTAAGYLIQRAPLRIEDAPRFPHREILMDSARHFLPVPAIKELLAAMAINKFNVLHWCGPHHHNHLLLLLLLPLHCRPTTVGGRVHSCTTFERLRRCPPRHIVDLQSFPFIAPRAPELARAAAFSPQERYTSLDVKEVAAFAADFGIRVVVEIDVPVSPRTQTQDTSLGVLHGPVS